MRVLVCGGRNYDDAIEIEKELSALNTCHGPISIIIHGGARGADTLAGMYAKEHDIPVKVFPANWKEYGVAAGSRRNRQMLEEGKPDVVLAFPGGAGTSDMVRQAEYAGLVVYRCGVY